VLRGGLALGPDRFVGICSADAGLLVHPILLPLIAPDLGDGSTATINCNALAKLSIEAAARAAGFLVVGDIAG
jgi:hypothetical protein